MPRRFSATLRGSFSRLCECMFFSVASSAPTCTRIVPLHFLGLCFSSFKLRILFGVWDSTTLPALRDPLRVAIRQSLRSVALAAPEIVCVRRRLGRSSALAFCRLARRVASFGAGFWTQRVSVQVRSVLVELRAAYSEWRSTKASDPSKRPQIDDACLLPPLGAFQLRLIFRRWGAALRDLTHRLRLGRLGHDYTGPCSRLHGRRVLLPEKTTRGTALNARRLFDARQSFGEMAHGSVSCCDGIKLPRGNRCRPPRVGATCIVHHISVSKPEAELSVWLPGGHDEQSLYSACPSGEGVRNVFLDDVVGGGGMECLHVAAGGMARHGLVRCWPLTVFSMLLMLGIPRRERPSSNVGAAQRYVAPAQLNVSTRVD